MDRVNQAVADRLEEVARLLEEQGANRFRVGAYRRAAHLLRALQTSVADVLRDRGLEGLEDLPGIGDHLARAIRDIVLTGGLAMLDRLRGGSDPLAVLASVPGIGPALAERIHHELGLGSLEDLELAAHDGRLERLPGMGAKRLAGIRDSLAQRLARVRTPLTRPIADQPAVAELLDVDHEYRQKSAAGRLRTIAPRRFNPTHEAWLPVLHTERGARHYTALFSNTPRAHQLDRTRDWVVLYYDGDQGERQCTVITSERGPLEGRRIVRGREAECAEFYRRTAG